MYDFFFFYRYGDHRDLHVLTHSSPTRRSSDLVFAACVVAGAAIGAHIGKAVDGRALILAFAAIMVIVGLAMLRPKAAGGDPDVQIDRRMAGRLAGIGLVTGMVRGFLDWKSVV